MVNLYEQTQLADFLAMKLMYTLQISHLDDSSFMLYSIYAEDRW